jgi:GDPmannose 4,6-dehydratase
MYGMLQAEQPMDFLIASGKTNSLRELVAAACRAAELKAEERVEACDDLFRPTDLTYSGMDPRLIEEKLGWKSSHTLEEIILKMHNGILF